MFRFPTLFLYILPAFATLVYGALFSIDFGCEWTKIGVIEPGSSMEIALNPESKRKSYSAISFKSENEVLYGQTAFNLISKKPQTTFLYLSKVIGSSINDRSVGDFLLKFPSLKAIPCSTADHSVCFKLFSDTGIRGETLLAMLIKKFTAYAQSYIQEVKKQKKRKLGSGVFVVPQHWNQAQRRAVLAAINIADIKVTQLVNDNTAIATNYALFHLKFGAKNSSQSESKKKAGDVKQELRVLYFDMGCCTTSATIVHYLPGKAEKETVGKVVGYGYTSIGGLEIQVRLRDYLARKFEKESNIKVFENERVMGKIFVEAGRIKNILSANDRIHAQIRELVDNKDLRVEVNRQDLESILSDMRGAIKNVFEDALRTSNLSMNAIDNFVLFGAQTRKPLVQNILNEIIKKDIGKNLNTDEAAALGALFLAAQQSEHFKASKLLLKNSILQPIHVFYERNHDDKDSHKDGGVVKISKTLYEVMGSCGQNKVLTLTKVNKNIDIFLGYSPDNLILKISLLNLESLCKKYLNSDARATSEEDENLQKEPTDGALEVNSFKGIKIHMNMSESCILSVGHAEALFQVSTKEMSTLGKLTNSIKNFFSSSEISPSNKNESFLSNMGNQSDSEVASNNSSLSNSTEHNLKKIITETINFEVVNLDLPEINRKEINKIKDYIKHIEEFERNKRKTGKALNELESFVIDNKYKLDSDEIFIASISEEDRSVLTTELEKEKNWIDEEGYLSSLEPLLTRVKRLKAMFKPHFLLMRENEKRPLAFKNLLEMIKNSTSFLTEMKNVTSSFNFFTPNEIERFDSLLNESERWMNQMKEKQKLLPAYETPVVSVEKINEKIDEISRENRYYQSKVKIRLQEYLERMQKEKAQLDNTTKSTPTVNSTQEEEVAESPSSSTIKPPYPQEERLHQNETSESFHPHSGEEL